MKSIDIYNDEINDAWYPASKSAGNTENTKMRILIERYEIILSDLKFITPDGFYTDMASVPKLLWGVFPPSGVDDLAFIVHDYLVWKKLTKTSVEAAEIMKYIQLKLGATKFRTQCMYLAVKYFGPKW